MHYAFCCKRHIYQLYTIACFPYANETHVCWDSQFKRFFYHLPVNFTLLSWNLVVFSLFQNFIEFCVAIFVINLSMSYSAKQIHACVIPWIFLPLFKYWNCNSCFPFLQDLLVKILFDFMTSSLIKLLPRN